MSDYQDILNPNLDLQLLLSLDGFSALLQNPQTRSAIAQIVVLSKQSIILVCKK